MFRDARLEIGDIAFLIRDQEPPSLGYMIKQSDKNLIARLPVEHVQRPVDQYDIEHAIRDEVDDVGHDTLDRQTLSSCGSVEIANAILRDIDPDDMMPGPRDEERIASLPAAQIEDTGALPVIPREEIDEDLRRRAERIGSFAIEPVVVVSHAPAIKQVRWDG